MLMIFFFIPLIAGVLIVLLRERHAYTIALMSLLLCVMVNGVVLFFFDRTSGTPHYDITIPWIPLLKSRFHLAFDYLNSSFVVLTTFLTLLATVASRTFITTRIRLYYVLILFLFVTVLGTFLAQDLLLFFVCWEASLFPLYLIILLWGGKKRIKAALKMFLYTLAGSLFMLIALVLLIFSTTSLSLSFSDIAQSTAKLSPSFQLLLSCFFALAFSVKLPLVPFHTWLPDAHVEAPTPGSMLLSGMLLKMGGYGFLRCIVQLFPEGMMLLSIPLLILGMISIIYGGFLAFAQEDIKKIIAYSSISHMGFVAVGIASMQQSGIEGALFHMFAHGITSAALFLSVGIVYKRMKTRILANLGGIAFLLPRFTILATITTLASLGLPGLIGFVGEFLIILGGMKTFFWYAAPIVLGILLSSLYMLKFLQGTFWGNFKKTEKKFPALTRSERYPLVVLVLSMIIGGVVPSLILSLFSDGVAILMH